MRAKTATCQMLQATEAPPWKLKTCRSTRIALMQSTLQHVPTIGTQSKAAAAGSLCWYAKRRLPNNRQHCPSKGTRCCRWL